MQGTGCRAHGCTTHTHHDILGKIKTVRCHVVNVASTGRLFVLPPAPAGLRPVLEPLATEVAKFAQLATLRQVREVAERRRETVGEGSHVLDTLLRRSLVHLDGLLGVEAQWLLRKDVLASCDGIEADLVVRVIRRRNHHSVDLRIGEHLLVVCGDLDWRPVFFALLQQSAGRAIA